MIEEERIAEAFDRLDNDNTGYISKANLINFLGSDKSTEEIEQLLTEADSNKDGKSKCTWWVSRKGILISHGLISQLMFRYTIVSYTEFTAIFRNRRRSVKRQIFEETESPDEVETGEDLLGLDAKIPGGRFKI
jgi:hypothetical protein